MVKRSITIGMITGLKGVRLLSIGVSYWYILMAKKDVDEKLESKKLLYNYEYNRIKNLEMAIS